MRPGTLRAYSRPAHPLSRMFTLSSLWIPFTIVAAFGQVARNAMHPQLTGPLGTWGATNIRFLFGLPFSVVFFVLAILVTGDPVPWPLASFWPWLLSGALSQIVGTGFMLLAMNDRSFVVTTAYMKTEAIQTAIFGFVFLGDHLTSAKVIAIVIATVGVVVTALRPGGQKSFADLRPTVLGLGAAAVFAISAVSFTAWAPVRPVKALALPELTTSARAVPRSSCLRHQSTAAEGHFERVNTPATAVPFGSVT